MTDSRAAVGFDRLPWLDDEPERSAASTKGTQSGIAGWLVAGALIVAGASYWLGQTSVTDDALPPATRSVPHSTTVPLPTLQPPQPQVEPERLPQVVQTPAPTVSVQRPRIERSSSRRAASSAEPDATALSSVEKAQENEDKGGAAATAKPAATPAEKPLTLWPAQKSQGASGRLVQIGAFGTRQQAKLGWRRMTRAYPAVGRLPATVVSARNSRGRYFYRFQIGTTSQAHSEVLCQRMERIRFSCAVVGLPGERKAVER